MRKTRTPSELVGYWLSEIKQAKERESEYRKTGKEVLKIYGADKTEPVPFNILYSNTETLLPALFSAIPRPVVERRFKDDDPVGKLASMAGKRMLEHLLDTNRDGYETFAEALEDVVMDSLLPGRGTAVIKYDAVFRDIPEPQPPDSADEAPPKAKTEEQEPAQYADQEKICPESLVWDRVYFGYAKKWHQVPWIAYEFWLTKEEVAGLLDEQAATKLKYTSEKSRGDDDSGEKDEKLGQRKTACLYQIWDKAGGKFVRYIAPSYKDDQLDEQEDPLGLTGFYNMPRPLQFVKKSSDLVPTAPYLLYRVQAQELNRITQRINKIVPAIKARGAYDGALGDLMKKIFDGDDNVLVAADSVSSLSAEKGFQNAIWMIPVDVLVLVLTQLYQAREACKQTIYEITGISDILRGSTQASETATAQTIKNQWGTLRLKRMQREVARYARDLMRMMLELAATKFSEETWAGITNLPFITTQQKQQLDVQAQALAKMQIPGQPVDPRMQALQQELSKPVWGQILDILKDDFQRSYRIDIETNSTVEPEAAEDQKAITDLLGAIGQTLNGIGPLVQSGVMPFQAAQSLLMFIARRFRFGSEIEDYIQAMQAPKPPEEDKTKEVEAQKQTAMQEVEHSKKQAEMSLKEKSMQAEMDHKTREMDLQLREKQLDIEKQKMAMEHQAHEQSFNMQKQRATEEIGTKQKIADLENKKYKTENVVNTKADTALGQGLKGMQGIVDQLVKAVAMQSQQNQQMIEQLVSAISRPRTKRAVRGKDGKIEAVEEMVA
jgi:hypothetical protein